MSNEPATLDPADAIRALLAWYVAIGVDEAIDLAPPERKPSARVVEIVEARPAVVAPRESRSTTAAPTLIPGGTPRPIEAENAERLAQACATLAELEAAIAGFEGCGLKATATRMVFADGDPAAPVMIIGEGPGAEEDRIGRPFVGPAGQLLDRMLAAIGLDRTGAYIANVVYWRPPGNRTPSAEELAICRPFIARQIELARPRLLVLAGNTAARGLLDRTDGITRLRGRWHEYRLNSTNTVIPALATYHPSYLLRSPGQKRMSWSDFLDLKMKLQKLDS